MKTFLNTQTSFWFITYSDSHAEFESDIFFLIKTNKQTKMGLLKIFREIIFTKIFVNL